jgi:hypothetical protein
MARGEFVGYELANHVEWPVYDGQPTPILCRFARKASDVLIAFNDLTQETREVVLEIQATMECPECEGYGESSYLNEWHSYKDETCRKCGGEKMIPVLSGVYEPSAEDDE